VILLILFVSFVVQVVHRPYMSTGERDLIQRELDRNCEKARNDPKFNLYNEIQHNVSSAKKIERENRRHQQLVRFEGHELNGETTKGGKDFGKRVRGKDFFFDYNTVEAVLLGSSILVCLCGLMFESGRFEGREDLNAQKEFITYTIFLVIFGSLVYYLMVFIAEVYQLNGTNRCLRFIQRRKHNELTQEEMDNDLIIDSNPLMILSASRAVNEAERKEMQAETDNLREAVTEVEQENAALRTELMHAKKNRQQNGAGATARGMQNIGKPKARKKQF